MMRTKTKARKTTTKKMTTKTNPKGTNKSKKSRLSLAKIFNFSRAAAKPKKNFSTSFEYGNLDIDIKSTITGNTVKLNFKIEGRDFSFTGNIVASERLLSHFESLFDHFKSQIKKTARHIRAA